MNKLLNRISFSNAYLKEKNLLECSEFLNNVSASDIRVLIYIEDAITRNYHNHSFYEEEDVKNLLLIKIGKDNIDNNKKLNSLIRYKTIRTIPLSYFEWALNDLRSLIYLGMFILHSNIKIPALKKNNYISFIKLVIRVNRLHLSYDGVFSFCNISFSRGAGTGPDDLIDNISIYKNNYLQERIKSSSIKWIDIKDDIQIDFLFDHLKNLNRIIMLDFFIPSNSEEKYAQILASIDYLPDLPSNENSDLPPIKKNGETIRREVSSVRGYYLNTMKNAWNGRVYRKEKLIEKSECQVSIAKGNFAKLSELSKIYNTSPNKLINEWIVKAHEVAVGDL